MRKQINIIFEGGKALVRFNLGTTGSHFRLLGNRLMGLRQALSAVDEASEVVAKDDGYWEASLPIGDNPNSSAQLLSKAITEVFPGHEVRIDITGLAKAA